MKILNAKDIDMPWVHVFLYGESGSGKTTAAATFPRPFSIVPANEGSMATLAGSDYPYTEIKDMRDMTNAVNTLEAEYKKDPEEFPYETIIFESLTHYCDLMVEDITQGGLKMMDQQGWGKVSAHLRNIGVRMRNMDINVVYIALSKLDPGGDGRRASGGPAIPGQSAIKIPAACDIVGYLQARPGGRNQEPTYLAHFRHHREFFARSRFKGVPPEIENFNFDEHIEPHLSK